MTPELVRLRLNRAAAPRRGRSDHDLNPGTAPDNPNLRDAAVLVPIINRPTGATVLLTRRTAHLSAHAGQISFPGGRVEPDDASAEAAALREAEEEIGLTTHLVELVGRLDTYRTVTNYEVTPVVGFVSPDFMPTPDPGEVAEVFEAPLGFLMEPANHHQHTGWFNGVPRHWWAMPWGDYYIWGATAGMLINLHDRLMEPY